MADYKTKLHDTITLMQQMTKSGELQRDQRLKLIDKLIEEYFIRTGEMPEAKALERFSDLCLYEELTDTDRMKTRNNEYPFFSETQFEERRKAEVSFKLSEEQGVDGRNYKPPVRRERTNRETKFIDKHARARNKERKQRYSDFTKVQPVIVRKIGL